MAEVVHRAIEPGPMLLLLGRELQFILDPLDIGIAVRDDLFGSQLRLTLGLGQYGLLAWLAALACFGGFRIRSARRGRLRVFPDAKHAGKHADDPANGA